MKIITQKATEAFFNKTNFNLSNTNVTNISGFTVLSLFGNQIAYLSEENILSITNRGYKTKTTKERLNGLRGVSIKQVKGLWFLNGKVWDGNLIEIK